MSVGSDLGDAYRAVGRSPTTPRAAEYEAGVESLNEAQREVTEEVHARPGRGPWRARPLPLPTSFAARLVTALGPSLRCRAGARGAPRAARANRRTARFRSWATRLLAVQVAVQVAVQGVVALISVQGARAAGAGRLRGRRRARLCRHAVCDGQTADVRPCAQPAALGDGSSHSPADHRGRAVRSQPTDVGDPPPMREPSLVISLSRS